MFSPELKVKRFLDSLAYCLLIGNTQGIETDYKRVMHQKREIPASSCPSFVDNMLYASGGATDSVDREECASFSEALRELDEQARKYATQRASREKRESLYHKHNRLGIRAGEWCRVDTDGVFECRGNKYIIPYTQDQYRPIDTEYGKLYDMDRILVTFDPPNKFYDMKYNEVEVQKL